MDQHSLVLGVTRMITNALGYFLGFAYYVQNQDAPKAVAINGVEPSVEECRRRYLLLPLSRFYFHVREAGKSLENRPEVSGLSWNLCLETTLGPS